MVEEDKTHEQAKRPHYRLYRRREVWLSIILGSLILLCGIAIGSSVVILRFREEMTHHGIHPERSPAIIAARMQRRLELSDEQTKKVEALLQKRFKAVHAAHKEAGKKINAEHKQLRAEMKKVLTDEQFELWDSHFKRMQERAARRDEPDRPRTGAQVFGQGQAVRRRNRKSPQRAETTPGIPGRSSSFERLGQSGRFLVHVPARRRNRPEIQR